MSRYYYNKYRRKKAKNSQGKILILSHLEALNAHDLNTQKTIYTEELEKVMNFFEGNVALNKKKECDDNLNKLKPLLNELAKESHSLGDEAFYDIKKTYFVEKKFFSKNDVTLHIRMYAKDETKGKRFLELAKSIADICDEIKSYYEYCKDIYQQVSIILDEHDALEYISKKEHLCSLLNHNFNLEDKKILLIYKGYYNKYGNKFYSEGEISKKFPKYFVNSMQGDTFDYQGIFGRRLKKHMVDYVPSTEPNHISYWNESKFMKQFLEISRHFIIPLEVYRPTINHKKKVIEVLERFLRKIELIERASIKQKEKTENAGYVYVLSNEAYPNIYKIGSTYSLPEERAEELTGTGHLTPFKVVAKIQIKSAEYYERSIHKLLNDYRVKQGREFFKLELNKIKYYLDKISEISNKGEVKVKINDLEKQLK